MSVGMHVSLVTRDRSVVAMEYSRGELRDMLNSLPTEGAVALVVTTPLSVQYFTAGVHQWILLVTVPLTVSSKCICKMSPDGHNAPNQEQYMLDHRCLRHGEKAQPAVWGRHRELQLMLDVDVYRALSVDVHYHGS